MQPELSGIEYVGARLCMARREKGLTQHLLARRAGTSQEVVQKIENGKSFRLRNSVDLAEALDINPAWLEFGAPYAGKAWSEEMPKRTKIH